LSLCVDIRIAGEVGGEIACLIDEPAGIGG